MIGVECPEIILWHRPHYPSDKYEYDKRLLLLDLSELKAPHEKAHHMFHFAKNELKLAQDKNAYIYLKKSLKYFYESGALLSNRLHLNLLRDLTELSLKQKLWSAASSYAYGLTVFFPHYAESWILKGYSCFYLGELDEAEFAFVLALKRISAKPNSPLKFKIYFAQARILILQEKFSEGLALFLRLYQNKPSFELSMHIARVYFLTGNSRLAGYWWLKNGPHEKDIITALQNFSWWNDSEVLQLKK